MGTGYTRQSTASMIDGQVIYAGDHNAEFNLLEEAFSGVSGHSHDGTLGEGPLISLTTSIQGVLSLSNGGTGATTASVARANLELGTLAIKSGPGVTVDNTIPRFDGVAGNLQSSDITIDDFGNLSLNNKVISGVADGTLPGHAINLGQLNTVEENLEEAFADAVENLQEQILTEKKQIGDFEESVRTLDSKWLRRNGAAYSSDAYPDLAAYFPPLPAGVSWEDYNPTNIEVFSGLTRLSNGEFAVVGGNYFQKSADWLTMTDRAQYRSGPTQAYTFTEYGDGVYVVCSSGGAPGPSAASGSYVSIDGGESFLQTGYPNNVPVNGLAWFNGMFIAFCIDDSSVHVSSDGITWTRHSTGWVGTNWAAYARHIIVGGEIFVVSTANDYFIYSGDGTTWTNATNAHICNDIAYVDGWFVTVAENGVIRRTNNFKTGTWETVSSGTAQNLNSITSNGGVLVAVGNGVTLMSTNNGAGWVTTGIDETRNISHTIDFSNTSNQFVASTPSGLIKGSYSLSPLFRVPNDNPTYGWIKALE